MRSGPGAMVSWRVVVFICTGDPESCTTKVSDLALTGTAGIPDRFPVDVDSESPAGIEPLAIAQLSGLAPPVAARLAEYAEPTSPIGNAVVAMASAGAA
jgi:hypothetical protein